MYYLIHNSEVRPQYDGENVTWKNVIYGFPCLWRLKRSEDAQDQILYQYLEMVKAWRNDESHISPTATEQEINLAISIIITMYFYATGCSITELESSRVFRFKRCDNKTF
jgi:type I restriction enzyme R subunit